MPGDDDHHDDRAAEVGEQARPEAPEVRQLVYVEREAVVSRFHGEPDEPWRVEEWADELRRAWASIPAQQKQRRLDLLLKSVGRRVRQEIQCLEADQHNDPDAILLHLREVYGERRSLNQLTGAFFEIRQRVSETTMCFSHRLHEAFTSVRSRQESTLDSETLKRQFVEGLRDRTLARVLARDVQRLNFNELKKEAMKWCVEEDTSPAMAAALQYRNVAPAVPASIPPPSPTPPPAQSELAALAESLTALSTAMTAGFKTLQDQLAAGQSRPGFNPDGKRLCYSCGKPGHFARECKKKSGNL